MLFRSITRLAGEGCAILISSHVLSELDEMADAAVYMTGGRTVGADRIAQAEASARAWRIRSLDPGALSAALAEIGVGPDISSRDNLGTLVQVVNEAAAADLLARLIGLGVPISAFGPAVGDLEHTFLDLSRNNATGEATL